MLNTGENLLENALVQFQKSGAILLFRTIKPGDLPDEC
jgi:hypothetical protein